MKTFFKKYKASAIVFTAVFLMYVLIVVLTHLVALNRMQDHLDLERRRTTNQVETSIEHYQVFSDYFYEVLITEDVLALMAEANNADETIKDQTREDLKTLLEDDYTLLESYDFRQFHFHLTTGESFLRLQTPKMYGDMLFESRESIRKASIQRVRVSGFEAGQTDIGYRFVYPLFYDDAYVGSVEFSVSYAAVLDALYTVTPNEDAFFILEKSVVEDSLAGAFKDSYTPSTLSEKYLRDTDIYASLTHERYNFQGLDLEQFLGDVTPNVKASIEGEASFSYATETDNRHYVLHFISIKNVENEHVGYLFTIVDDAHYAELIRENRTNIGLISLFFVMLFTLFFISAKDRVKLRQLSRKDPLSGLANRLFFTSQVEALLGTAKREKTRLSLIMIDIDDFKQVNDTYGHAEGDNVLKDLSNTFTDTLRESDIIGRWGGEEFLIALPKTNEDSALKVAQKIRKAVKYNVHTSSGIPITISLGIATFNDNRLSFDTLVKRADEALYESKDNGKNQVTLYKN